MLRNLLFILLIVFIVFLQSTVFGFFAVNGQAVDLLLIFSLVLFFRPDRDRALLAVVFGGALYDLLNLNPVIGLWGLAAVIFFALTYWFSANLLENFALRALVVFIFAGLFHLITAFPGFGFPSLLGIISGSFINLTAYLILLAPLNFLFDRLFRENYLQLDFHDRL